MTYDNDINVWYCSSFIRTRYTKYQVRVSRFMFCPWFSSTLSGTGNLFLSFFSPHPFYIPDTLFALFLSPSPSLDVTQIRGHSKQALLRPPNYGTRLRLHREKAPVLSSPVDPHRIAPTHHAARRSQQSIPVSFFFIFAQKRKKKSPTHVGFEPQNKLYY